MNLHHRHYSSANAQHPWCRLDTLPTDAGYWCGDGARGVADESLLFAELSDSRNDMRIYILPCKKLFYTNLLLEAYLGCVH